MHIENVVGLMFVKIDIGMLILAILVSMLVNVHSLSCPLYGILIRHI